MSRIASRPATVNHYGRVPIGWDVKPLGQVSINHDRKRKPLSKIQRQQRPGPFPYYGAAKVFDYIDDYIFDGTHCLIAEDGSVVTPDGHPVMQLATGKFWPNNHTHILEGKAPATTRYLYYYLKGFDITGYITGAAQPKITQENLNRIPVLVPPVEVLGRTAAILSAYDDLIENNLRRIKILEEMAQALYREWFVNFRFPGHESVRMVDSEQGRIPEGWEVSELSAIATIVDCLHDRKPDRLNAGECLLLHVWNVGRTGKLDLSERFYISEGDYAHWTRRIEVSGGDVTISKTGRVGAVAQIPGGVKATIGRNLVAIRFPRAPTFLLQYLLSSHKDVEVQPHVAWHHHGKSTREGHRQVALCAAVQ